MKASSISKIIVKSITQTNWKAMLFFTSFTFLLWLILQFTKTHTIDYVISIEFSDVPVKEVLLKKEVDVTSTIKKTGFWLFKKNFMDSSIQLPVGELEKSDSVYLFQSKPLVSLISRKLDLAEADISIENKTLAIPFSIKSTKQVPIETRLKLNFSKSYASYDGVQWEMDSVKIAGPLHLLKDISSVKTADLILKNLNSKRSGELKLINPFPKEVVFEKASLGYNIHVERFTEQWFILPVQIENLPDKYQIELLPNKVEVGFQSSLEDMDDINPEDFEVVCDFNSALSKASLLIPKLKKQPKKAIRIQLQPNQIEYILRK